VAGQYRQKRASGTRFRREREFLQFYLKVTRRGRTALPDRFRKVLKKGKESIEGET